MKIIRFLFSAIAQIFGVGAFYIVYVLGDSEQRTSIYWRVFSDTSPQLLLTVAGIVLLAISIFLLPIGNLFQSKLKN